MVYGRLKEIANDYPDILIINTKMKSIEKAKMLVELIGEDESVEYFDSSPTPYEVVTKEELISILYDTLHINKILGGGYNIFIVSAQLGKSLTLEVSKVDEYNQLTQLTPMDYEKQWGKITNLFYDAINMSRALGPK